MSKIYKRPMFRGGGKVSSYGNGIATGLADGGRVGLRLGGPPLFDPAVTGSLKPPPTKANLVNLGGGQPASYGKSIFDNAINNAKTNTSKIKSGIGNIKSGIGKMEFNERGLLKGLKKIPGYLDKGVGGLRYLGRKNPYLTGMAATGYVTRNLPIDELISEQEGYGFIEGKARKLLDPTYTSKIIDIYKQGYNEDGELNARIALEEEKSKPTPDQQRITELLEELRLAKEIKDEGEGEVLVEETRKERLKRTAKEYQEILGDGIKKDSIFDAMIAGGTSLMAGEGYASAIRQANKELDPIQNIKTASRKLAVEEDIAMRKAIALDKTKRTATSDIIALGKSSGKSDAEIYKDVIKNKSKSKAEIIAGYKTAFGTGPGFKEYVKDTYGSNIKFFDVDIEKVDFETVENGEYYQPPTGKADKYKDKFITVKDNKVVKVTPRNR